MKSIEEHEGWAPGGPFEVDVRAVSLLLRSRADVHAIGAGHETEDVSELSFGLSLQVLKGGRPLTLRGSNTVLSQLPEVPVEHPRRKLRIRSKENSRRSRLKGN